MRHEFIYERNLSVVNLSFVIMTFQEFIMQTLAVQVQDNYIQDFMSYINNHSENITIKKDKNLEFDS